MTVGAVEAGDGPSGSASSGSGPPGSVRGGPAPDTAGPPRAPRGTTPAELTAAALVGDRRALARILSLVEDSSSQLREISALLAPHAGRARVVGLTGPPGVGKSTTTSALVAAYRARGMRVGVLAVDPSSPFTGGALLGDRVRMSEHATDPGVFIRSLATRGHLGGLSWATPQALRVLDAVGFDLVLVETVGVGQAEVDIASLADTTLVLLAPGMGDGVQAAKAGIMEIADVLVLNKADRPGTDQAFRDLVGMTRLAAATRGEPGADGDGQRFPVVVRTVASDGTGIADLVEAIEGHHGRLVRAGELDRRRQARMADEIAQIALGALRSRLVDPRGGVSLDRLAAAVLAGRTDPYTAAEAMLRDLEGVRRASGAAQTNGARDASGAGQ